ncbi:PREDICTED: uncharacterized protein LOC108620992 isoform X2 [Drosophila arizonae]|uniref:Uncharacterized protein LOC108620992 isoform X2 n=1 Tax=Drosophila arizonae TaxID=7263 RepID=A0ABM1Q261_DROAR|nr:PREDICTED: uncharacterized protein LOC108620992 isoform X2 [Drosophila arizonae]
MANLEQHLQLLNAKFINIDANRRSYTHHYGRLRDQLYSMLRQEEPLGKWLCGHKLGSYADNLKVTKPDEFDLVLHLTFPENDKIIVRKNNTRAGHVILDMTNVLKALHKQRHNEVTLVNLKNIVSRQNFLVENKLQDLINGAVTRALNKMNKQIEVDGKVTPLVYRRCGPAFTLFINERNMKYSVDFVPAIRLKAEQNVLAQERRKYFRNISHWSAIPKPLKQFQNNNVFFRASYDEAECAMLKGNYKLKDVIRLMKKFRDSKQNISTMKSYYIKTILLWQIDARPKNYWKTKQLHEILIDMFRELENCLAPNGKNGKLLYFWDSKLNLFSELTEHQRNDMLNCISAVIDKLTAAATNLTDAIREDITNSFTNRLERSVEDNEEKCSHTDCEDNRFTCTIDIPHS